MRCLAIAVALTCTAGCYDPTFKDGLPCSQTDKCPDGQSCVAGICTAGGNIDIDAARADAPPPDAPPFDPPLGIDVAVGGPNYVFATAATFNSNLGGLAGADAKCQAEADAAGLPGTYVAWLSTTTVDARDRLTGARGWIRRDGKQVVDTVADLVAGRMWFPPRLDAAGNDLGGGHFVWSMTTADGVYATAETGCEDWTSTIGATVLLGRADSTFDGYTADVSIGACDTQDAALLCFGVDRNEPVGPPNAETGRVAFVSVTTYTPMTAGTITMLDDICNSEATNHSLPGTYKAAVAVPGATAASRFDTGAGTMPWRRLDGIRLTDEPAEMFDGSLLHTSPNMTAAGDPTPAPVWFGAISATSVGNSSCDGWASNTGSGSLGNPRSSDSVQVFGSGDIAPCADPHVLLCLQE